MTREDAIKTIWGHPVLSNINDVQGLISSIFDDFENKSCDGCKYDEKDDSYPSICWECSRYYADNYELKDSQ